MSEVAEDRWQQEWDEEVCAGFRRRIMALTQKVRQLQAGEPGAREAFRERRKERKKAQGALSEFIEGADNALGNADFAHEVRVRTAAVWAAQVAEMEARQAWRVLAVKRREAQLSLQETIEGDDLKRVLDGLDIEEPPAPDSATPLTTEEETQESPDSQPGPQPKIGPPGLAWGSQSNNIALDADEETR